MTLDPELGKQDTWWRYMPRVFTEQGVSMLSAVLRSDTAIDVSVRIMDAFVEMRHFIVDNAHMFEQIRSIDHRLDGLERSTDERSERVFDYMERTRLRTRRSSSRARSTTRSSSWSLSCRWPSARSF